MRREKGKERAKNDCLITAHTVAALSATPSFTIPDCTATSTGTATIVAAGNYSILTLLFSFLKLIKKCNI